MSMVGPANGECRPRWLSWTSEVDNALKLPQRWHVMGNTFIRPTPPSSFGGRSRLAKTEAFCLHCLRRHLCVSCKSISLPPKASSTPSHLLGALFLLINCTEFLQILLRLYFCCIFPVPGPQFAASHCHDVAGHWPVQHQAPSRSRSSFPLSHTISV
jgi:hypothetical protein